VRARLPDWDINSHFCRELSAILPVAVQPVSTHHRALPTDGRRGHRAHPALRRSPNSSSPPPSTGHVHRGLGVAVSPGVRPAPPLQPRRVPLQVRASSPVAQIHLYNSCSDLSVVFLSRLRACCAKADAAGGVVARRGGGGRANPRGQGRGRRGHVAGVHQGREAGLLDQRPGA
jgi:hypothetical protein